MKVYVVLYWVQVGDARLEKIFSDEESARKWAENHEDPNNYEVVEWDVEGAP